MSTYTIGLRLDGLILVFVSNPPVSLLPLTDVYAFFCIYVLCTYKRCASHLFSRSLAFFTLYYVYVQASRTRVSEAYTELEPTFAYEKLESNIVLNDYFNVSYGQQQRNRCWLLVWIHQLTHS